jgi:hypothetical protein
MQRKVPSLLKDLILSFPNYKGTAINPFFQPASTMKNKKTDAPPLGECPNSEELSAIVACTVFPLHYTSASQVIT